MFGGCLVMIHILFLFCVSILPVSLYMFHVYANTSEASWGLWIPSPGLQAVGIWFVSAGNDTQVRARAADALNCWDIFPATEFTFVFLVQGIWQYFVEFGFTESTLPRDSL